MWVLPYVGALDSFLAIWVYLPQPARALVTANLFFFAAVGFVRLMNR